MDYLMAQIPVRPLLTPEEVMTAERDRIIEVAAWLGYYPTMDEWEEGVLTELPGHLKAALLTLKTFTFEGRLRQTPDHRDRFIRLCSHVEVFVQNLSVSGDRVKVSGSHSADVGSYLTRNLQELFIPQTQDDLLTLEVPVTADRLLEETVSTFRDALRFEENERPLPFTTERTPERLKFQVPGLQSTPERLARIETYLHQNYNYHRVTTFFTASAQDPTFLRPLLESLIRDGGEEPFAAWQELIFDPLPNNEWAVRYLVTPEGYQYFEYFDELILLALTPFLDERRWLRYISLPISPLSEEAADFGGTQNVIPSAASQLTQLFCELEDLVLVDGLIAPTDRRLQYYYAQVQGYPPTEIVQQVLQRYQDFLLTGTLHRRISKALPREYQALTLHYLFAYLALLWQAPAVALNREVIVLEGEFPLLADGLGLFGLLLLAQAGAARGERETLAKLRSVAPGLLPSELIALLDTSEDDLVFPSCPVLSEETERSTDPHIVRLPRSQVPNLSKFRKWLTAQDPGADVVLVRYRAEGVWIEEYSLYTTAVFDHYLPEELFSEEPEVITPSPVRIASEDYRLEIVAAGKYYRLDVISMQLDQPLDRFTLCWLPQQLKLEHPLLLDQFHTLWKRGELLTASARHFYRLTNKLWTINTIPPQIQALTPSYWESLTSDQVDSMLAQLVKKAKN